MPIRLTYTIILKWYIIIDHQGCYDTGTFKVIVFPNPAGSVTVSDTIHGIGKNTLIFDNPATNVISYHWDFGDGRYQFE